MTTVLSNEFSVLLLIGTGLMILALLAGIHIYIPKNKQYQYFLSFFVYHVIACFFLMPSLISYVFDGRNAFSKSVLYLFFFLIMNCIMLYIYNMLRSDRHIYKKISVILLAAFFIQMVYSSIQLLKMMGVPFAIDFITTTGPIFGRGIDSMKAYWLKLYGLTEEPSALANYIIFMMPWLLIAKSFIQKNNIFIKAIYLLLIALGMVILFFTFSRTAYFGALIAILIGALIFKSEIKYRLIHSKIKNICLIVIISSAITFIPTYVSSVWEASINVDDMVDQLLTSFLDPQERAASSSNITRTGGMMAGIKIFFDHPLLGTGFGTQSLYQAEYYPIWAKDSEEVVSGLSVVEPTTHRYREMPSVLLTRVLAEGGIIGFFIWLLMFAYIVYDCVYMWKHTPYHNDILFFKSIAWMVCISQLLSFNINYIFDPIFILLFPVYWDVHRRFISGEKIIS